MLIANPIYDVVFKYLFEDNNIAKKILSLILEKNIVKLDLAPTELKSKVDDGKRFMTIFKIDFSAKIRNDDGSEELVIIEIQKAKFASDIMRFRRYLGSQYADENNQYEVKLKSGRTKKQPLPIISIYFLGHKLKYTKVPAIHVARSYKDLSTKEKITIDVKEDFIESLTHDSYIIQIPYLKEKRQNELLQVLSVFDQDNVDSNKHILNIEEDEMPDEYKEIIRRLQKAMAKKEISDIMTLEDEVLKDLEDKEREIEDNKKIIDDNKKIIEEKEKVIEEKEKVIKMALELLVFQGMSEEEAKKKLNLKS